MSWTRLLSTLRPAASASSIVARRWAPLQGPNALLFSSLFSSNDGPAKPSQQPPPPPPPLQRTEVELREADLDESFVKGSGKGGQKINKVRNCVLLTHVPTGLQVRCQKTRSLDGNRRAARKLLLQKLDDHVNGALSKRSEKIERLRRKKASRRAKSKQKYAKSEEQQEGDDEQEDEEGEESYDDEEDEDDGEEDEDDGEDDFIDLEQHRFKAKKKEKK